MPGAGCADYRCCIDEPEDIPACWKWKLLVGFVYNGAMDPVHHPECWTGITRDGAQPEQTGCRTCDHGCDNFKDDFTHLIMDAGYLGGKSYLRPQLGHRFGRNARNEIFDLKSGEPVLIQRRCSLEHGSCYENYPMAYGSPDGWVCWGHHVCQCTPEPDYAIGGPPPYDCDTADAGYPVIGLTPIHYFFNFHGWAPSSAGPAPAADMFCRQFDPVSGGASPQNAPISVHRQNDSYNAVFLRQRAGMNMDILVPCSGFISPSSCINATTGDCTYGGVRPGPTVYIDEEATHGKYDEVRIDLDSVDLKMRAKASDSAQITQEKQLYADVLAEVIGRTFPIDENPWTITMDRLAMNLPSNTYIGKYDRVWDGRTLDVDDLPVLFEFPHSYTRWGRVPVTARMVAVRVSMKLHLTVPHFISYIPPTINTQHYIGQYAYFEIDVRTAMRVDSVTTPITVGGEPVVVTEPEFIWGQGFDGIPQASPSGNRIVYARSLGEPVRVARRWRWVGRLGAFSEPVASWTPVELTDLNCEDMIDFIGQIRVPGLATANDSNPSDPNQNYDGEISFAFSHEA